MVEIRVGVSARALFDLEKENKIYHEKGLEKYIKYNESNEDKLLEPGVAFKIIKNILALNSNENIKTRVILMSRSSPDIATRIFKSTQQYGLPLEEAYFTSGESLSKYAKSCKVDLYLSANEEDVKAVLDSGIAAGCIQPNKKNKYTEITVPENPSDDIGLRVAFDCDGVLFSDECDTYFSENGLEEFEINEQQNAKVPISDGPFKQLLIKLGKIQEVYGFNNDNPIKIAICTARGFNVHERCLSTLKSWGVRVSQAFFLAGSNKAEALEAFDADIFFDDNTDNVNKASKVVPTCKVFI